MKFRYKLITLSGLLLFLFGWMHFKHPIKTITVDGTLSVPLGLHLPPNFGHGYTLKQSSGFKHTLIITPKAIGFPFDIGLSIAIGSGIQLYLTTEMFYYRHFELLAGLGGQYHLNRPVAMAALGYRLPWQRVDNISLFTGINTEKAIIAGLYLRFGSN
jgi:hypothetical protein